VCLFATGFKKARAEGKQCHGKTMKRKRLEVGKTLKEEPFMRRLGRTQGRKDKGRS
jgi:hypothetical protein